MSMRVPMCASRITLVVVVFAIGLVSFLPSAKADDDNYTTAQLVARCSAAPRSCQAQIGMGVVMGLSGKCVPSSMAVPSDAQVLRVIHWVKAHPHVHPDDWGEAVDAAETALYPCSK